MKTSTYDPCLLISKEKEYFGIVGIQTDDTLILGNESFKRREQEELEKANFLSKPIENLTIETPLIFNGSKLTLKDNSIFMTTKGQGNQIKLVNVKSSSPKEEYMSQCARGAYIAGICQPEAAFDLSIAAQHQNPSDLEINLLNKRLLWQINHIEKGLRYIPVDLSKAKLFVFVDGSFANNHDLTSQIGFIIVLASESIKSGEFTIGGNIIHWSSIKCRRVTRSVLASELYAMVLGIDVAFALSSTLKEITQQLGFPNVPTIVCTDSFSLYECVVKFGTTKEKRLMIDVMAIRESYERRELSEIRWINGNDNPADAMTKATPTKSLEVLVNTNKFQVRMEGWVERKNIMNV